MKTKLLPFLLFVFATNTFATDLTLDTPTEDFTINNDGTVLHKKTGLTWQRCTVGQTWNATTSTCDGTTSTMNWNDAMAKYSTGKTCDEWRLPRIDELNTIADHGKFKPAINSIIFPNTNADVWFWSASVDAYSSPDYAWLVNFQYGNSNSDVKNNNFAVRLVHGGLSCSFDTFTPTSDFIDHNNGTITHTKTGLMWQRCAVGQTWTGAMCDGSPSIMNYETAIKQTSTLGSYNDWRLPTLNELKTIVEYKSYGPAINTTIFLSTPENVWFWSTSVSANNPDFAWIVYFGSGFENGWIKNDNSNDNSDSGAVRLVRGGQSSSFIPLNTSVDLSTTITGNSIVKINQNITYTATASNIGNASANNVILTLHLPPRVVKISSAPENCEIRPLSVLCSVGILAPNASVSKDITLSFNRAGGSSLVSSVRTSDTDSNKINNNARVITSVKK